MIELTRLNGAQIVLNSDLIKTAESSPDTMLTLINGEKLIVRETCAEVSERCLRTGRACWPQWPGAPRRGPAPCCFHCQPGRCRPTQPALELRRDPFHGA